MNHRNTKVRELEQEINSLNKTIDFSAHVNELLQKKYDKLDRERINYRRIVKYQTVLMIIMNLLTNTCEETDINRILKTNINEFYKNMTKDLMQIASNDNEEFDDEEGYDESESSDLWNGEEEFE